MASLYGRYSLQATIKLLFISAFTLLLLCQSNRYIIKKISYYSADSLYDSGGEDGLEDNFDGFSLFPVAFSFVWWIAKQHFIPACLFIFILTCCLYRLHCIYRL